MHLKLSTGKKVVTPKLSSLLGDFFLPLICEARCERQADALRENNISLPHIHTHRGTNEDQPSRRCVSPPRFCFTLLALPGGGAPA